MKSALVIEIARRAKAMDGEPNEAEETESETGDVDAIKESAATDLVKALGLDPADVDMPAVTGALSDFAEACSAGGYGKSEKE